MKILIYDDSQNDVNHLIELLTNFEKEHQIQFEITKCISSSFLLNNINEYDLLFLDVELKNENGIEIGKKLNTIQHDCKILITSAYKKYLIEGYKIHAERYFLKPISTLEFNEEINEVIQSIEKHKAGFLDVSISKDKILYKDILYIDTFDRKTRIHFINGKYLDSIHTMKDWNSILDPCWFFMIHKSVIINLNYVSKYTKSDVIMNTDISLPLSRNYRKEFEERYIKVIMGGLL